MERSQNFKENSKVVYVVTHGSRLQGVNPSMSKKGQQEIEGLRKFLPNTNSIVCGTGRRHLDMASRLKLEPERYTPLAGGPESLFLIDERKMVMLSNGTAVDKNKFTGVEDLKLLAKPFIFSLEHNSVILSGRPFMIMLGEKNAKSATVYKIIMYEENFKIEVMHQSSKGKTEKGTV